MVEDGLHPAVLAQHLGGEAGDPGALGDRHEVGEQRVADAAALPLVAHGEGDLGAVGLLVEVVAPDRDDFLAVRLGDGADDRDVAAVVDVDVVEDLRCVKRCTRVMKR